MKKSFLFKIGIVLFLISLACILVFGILMTKFTYSDVSNHEKLEKIFMTLTCIFGGISITSLLGFIGYYLFSWVNEYIKDK